MNCGPRSIFSLECGPLMVFETSALIIVIVFVTGSLFHDGEVDGDREEQDKDADDDPFETVSSRCRLISIPQRNVTDQKS
jgi:hypothetical protein